MYFSWFYKVDKIIFFFFKKLTIGLKLVVFLELLKIKVFETFSCMYKGKPLNCGQWMVKRKI
ncbi:hypothetical protein EGI26_21210 [Lacihabitans sp. CCS-44]|nr:hypothetical protein [Lacihabitans sp. CCS-44]